MITIVKEDTNFQIEGITYYVMESYVKGGSGYTFRVTSDTYTEYAENVFQTNEYDLVILGEKKNYLARRVQGKLQYKITGYRKNTLKLSVEKNEIYKIYFKNTELLGFYSSSIDDVLIKELSLAKMQLRKEKINKIQKVNRIKKPK